MEFKMEYLYGMIPLILINLGLVVFCLLDWIKRKEFRWLGKWGWFVIFIGFQFIGPVLYIILIKNNDDHKV
jgi:hypothetical protein